MRRVLLKATWVKLGKIEIFSLLTLGRNPQKEMCVALLNSKMPQSHLVDRF